MRKKYTIMAILAAAILAAAAVLMGGLNQDEGWYLYAANLVADGQMPYRDFFYTQGPLMPVVYSAFTWIWTTFGLLGARVFTLLLGLGSIALAALLARRMVPEEKKGAATVAVIFLLGCNLYHLYYLAIPKTYALASLFVMGGAYLMGVRQFFLAGLAFAFAAGTRISLGMLLAAGGFSLLIAFRRYGFAFLRFGFGGLLGLAIVFGPFLMNDGALTGLIAAQKYHAAREGFSPMFLIGSLSRLVRWYLPIWILLGLAVFHGHLKTEKRPLPIFAGFLAVFLLQMLAPYPYEDYQVPIMGLLCVGAVSLFFACYMPISHSMLLILGLSFATAFGSPLLENWTTSGPDRFWTRKKDKPELFQLREAARKIEALDPGGKELLTQDLYLAIETRRRVPKGLEMGPFSILADEEWVTLLNDPKSPKIAALSGYSFAIDPPKCNERPKVERELYWSIVKDRYDLNEKIHAFGQNATVLRIFTKKGEH